MNIKNIFEKIHENFWIVIVSSFICAFLFSDIWMIFKPYVHYMLIAIMTLSCMKIDFQAIKKFIKKPIKLFKILFIIHILPPLLIFPLKSFLTNEQFLGMIIVSSVSCAISVIFLSKLFKGDINSAVVIVSLSTLLNPIFIPLITYMFASKSIEINYFNMLKTIAELIIIPIILGQILKRTNFKEKISSYSTIISTTLLFLILTSIIAPTKKFILNDINSTIKILSISFIITTISFILGFRTGENIEEKITFGLASSFKNFAFAAVLIFKLFPEKVAIAPIVYTLVGNLFLAPLHIFTTKFKK